MSNHSTLNVVVQDLTKHTALEGTSHRFSVVPETWRSFADKIVKWSKATTLLLLPRLNVPSSHRYGAMASVDMMLLCSHDMRVNYAYTLINSPANTTRGTSHCYEYVISVTVDGQRAVPAKAANTTTLTDASDMRDIIHSSFGYGNPSPDVVKPAPIPKSASDIARQLEELDKDPL